MDTPGSSIKPYIKVRGTELLATGTRRQHREKLARITLDSMVQFVGLLDAHGTVLEINQVALDGVGIKLADVEGQPFWTTFWWQVSEDINATLRESIARAAKGEFVRWDAEIFGRSGGAETIIIDASLCPVLDEHGKVVFIAAEGRDITEKKAIEREIARKNVDLQALLERIRELDEIKTQFFANVSHELRTPLALIIGPAERLLQSDPPLKPEAQRETAQVIVRNARMLLKHVNDLLDISKLEAGKLKIELQDTSRARSAPPRGARTCCWWRSQGGGRTKTGARQKLLDSIITNQSRSTSIRWGRCLPNARSMLRRALPRKRFSESVRRTTLYRPGPEDSLGAAQRKHA